MVTARDLIVFACLAGPESRFVPAGRLSLTEIATPNPAARELASAFAYGTRYLERHDSFELDNALSRFTAFLPDRAAVLNIIRRVWSEIRQWTAAFESFGALGLLIDQLDSAFRPLDEIASPSLIRELRLRRWPQDPGSTSTADG